MHFTEHLINFDFNMILPEVLRLGIEMLQISDQRNKLETTPDISIVFK